MPRKPQKKTREKKETINQTRENKNLIIKSLISNLYYNKVITVTIKPASLNQTTYTAKEHPKDKRTTTFIHLKNAELELVYDVEKGPQNKAILRSLSRDRQDSPDKTRSRRSKKVEGICDQLAKREDIKEVRVKYNIKPKEDNIDKVKTLLNEELIKKGQTVKNNEGKAALRTGNDDNTNNISKVNSKVEGILQRYVKILENGLPGEKHDNNQIGGKKKRYTVDKRVRFIKINDDMLKEGDVKKVESKTEYKNNGSSINANNNNKVNKTQDTKTKVSRIKVNKSKQEATTEDDDENNTPFFIKESNKRQKNQAKQRKEIKTTNRPTKFNRNKYSKKKNERNDANKSFILKYRNVTHLPIQPHGVFSSDSSEESTTVKRFYQRVTNEYYNLNSRKIPKYKKREKRNRKSDSDRDSSNNDYKDDRKSNSIDEEDNRMRKQRNTHTERIKTQSKTIKGDDSSNEGEGTAMKNSRDPGMQKQRKTHIQRIKTQSKTIKGDDSSSEGKGTAIRNSRDTRMQKQRKTHTQRIKTQSKTIKGDDSSNEGEGTAMKNSRGTRMQKQRNTYTERIKTQSKTIKGDDSSNEGEGTAMKNSKDTSEEETESREKYKDEIHDQLFNTKTLKNKLRNNEKLKKYNIKIVSGSSEDTTNDRKDTRNNDYDEKSNTSGESKVISSEGNTEEQDTRKRMPKKKMTRRSNRVKIKTIRRKPKHTHRSKNKNERKNLRIQFSKTNETKPNEKNNSKEMSTTKSGQRKWKRLVQKLVRRDKGRVLDVEKFLQSESVIDLIADQLVKDSLRNEARKEKDEVFEILL